MPNDKETNWTVLTLKTYVDSLFVERDRRYAERFEASQIAVTSAFDSAQNAVVAALESAEKAVAKAESATEKRFEGVNEFRGQLADQQRTFIPRLEADLRFKTLENQVAVLINQAAQRSGAVRGGKDMWGYIIGAIGVLLAIASYFGRIR